MNSNISFSEEEKPNFENQEYQVTFTDNLNNLLEKLNAIKDKNIFIHAKENVSGIQKQIESFSNQFEIPFSSLKVPVEIPHVSASEIPPASKNESRTVVQNLIIQFPDFNINSPADMKRLGDALTETIAENLDVKEMRDNRNAGGIGWQI